MKFFFRILLVVFVMQSTWAVAAQYCQHEESPKVDHLGHHEHKHDSQNDDFSDTVDQSSSDSSKFSADTDCPYCHLGTIKSMIAYLLAFDASIELAVIVDVYDSYPEIIPLKPERPIWILAV